MPSTGVSEFYDVAVNSIEQGYDDETFRNAVLDIQDHIEPCFVEMQPHISREISRSGSLKHFEKLNGQGLRMSLSYSRGLQLGTTDLILNFDNVFLPRRANGRPMSPQETVKTSSFFDGFHWQRLLDQKNPFQGTEPWYFVCRNFPDKAVRPSKVVWQRPETNMKYHYGCREYDGRRTGVTLFTSKNFSEVTLTTQDNPPANKNDWEAVLHEMSEEFAQDKDLQDGPTRLLYVRDRSLFNHTLRIDRLIGYNLSDPRALAWVYRRVLSPTVWRVAYGKEQVIRPNQERMSVVNLVHKVTL